MENIQKSVSIEEKQALAKEIALRHKEAKMHLNLDFDGNVLNTHSFSDPEIQHLFDPRDNRLRPGISQEKVRGFFSDFEMLQLILEECGKENVNVNIVSRTFENRLLSILDVAGLGYKKVVGATAEQDREIRDDEIEENHKFSNIVARETLQNGFGGSKKDAMDFLSRAYSSRAYSMSDDTEAAELKEELKKEGRGDCFVFSGLPPFESAKIVGGVRTNPQSHLKKNEVMEVDGVAAVGFGLNYTRWQQYGRDLDKFVKLQKTQIVNLGAQQSERSSSVPLPEVESPLPPLPPKKVASEPNIAKREVSKNPPPVNRGAAKNTVRAAMAKSKVAPSVDAADPLPPLPAKREPRVQSAPANLGRTLPEAPPVPERPRSAPPIERGFVKPKDVSFVNNSSVMDLVLAQKEAMNLRSAKQGLFGRMFSSNAKKADKIVAKAAAEFKADMMLDKRNSQISGENIYYRGTPTLSEGDLASISINAPGNKFDFETLKIILESGVAVSKDLRVGGKPLENILRKSLTDLTESKQDSLARQVIEYCMDKIGVSKNPVEQSPHSVRQAWGIENETGETTTESPAQSQTSSPKASPDSVRRAPPPVPEGIDFSEEPLPGLSSVEVSYEPTHEEIPARKKAPLIVAKQGGHYDNARITNNPVDRLEAEEQAPELPMKNSKKSEIPSPSPASPRVSELITVEQRAEMFGGMVRGGAKKAPPLPTRPPV